MVLSSVWRISNCFHRQQETNSKQSLLSFLLPTKVFNMFHIFQKYSQEELANATALDTFHNLFTI